MKYDPTDEHHHDAGGHAFGTERDRTVAVFREQYLVRPRQFAGDLGARITRTDDQDASVLKLPRILVFGNAKLDDPRDRARRRNRESKAVASSTLPPLLSASNRRRPR